ncbi:putative rRNA maturation factor [Pullulanibacillus pueri]|uniref:Endoribonuclease YbeY n=1 Tax=Pullulanibacillus pueri TaxID=1437324 RepID=A0A8J2ZXT9_9BACL|nr:rRNA maturation RNase YbeY [Pullulanibacillus pueri]MBM7683041.1 putative rRNA maturation factor [Pullulanibacillus pueri]GGH84983.1 endoribonuclease YbeY [Pullulanibacillus pueri]
MPLTIDYNNEQNLLKPSYFEMLTGLLNHAAEQLNIGEAELSLTFVDNETIQDINHRYRDKNQPTDVISFALEEKGPDEIEIVGEDVPRILGDVIISIPKVEEQASEHGHSFERELGFLAVHGLLHLLGYDHMTKEEEEQMFSLQEDILSSYGLKRG